MSGKYWIGTLPTRYAAEFTFWNEAAMTYCIGQKELSDSGLEHWQFVVGLARKSRLTAIKRLFPQQTHFELTRSDAAHSYVHKEDTAIAGSQFSYGDLPLRRNNKTDWKKVRDLAKAGSMDDIPDDVFIRYYSSLQRIRVEHSRAGFRHDIRVIVFHGGTGLGKTRRAWHEAPNAYIKNPNTKWWDSYRGEKEVILDEFTGRFDISYLLTWLDRYPCMVECKGSSAHLQAETLYITSNLSP